MLWAQEKLAFPVTVLVICENTMYFDLQGNLPLLVYILFLLKASYGFLLAILL